MSEQQTINMPRKIVMPRKIKIHTRIKANGAAAGAGAGAAIGAGLGEQLFGSIIRVIAGSVFGLELDETSSSAVAQSILGLIGAVSGGWLGAFIPALNPKRVEVELDDGEPGGSPA